jgi:CRISPR/Cas system CSM-associated protein Csm3 (group 7 of RAMP superfamily)
MSGAHWLHSREIVERILIEGDLVLETPAHFGGGEAGSLSDMPLFVDPLEEKALLTGSSLAGALRSYLRARELGYWQRETPDCLAASLFGPLQFGESPAEEGEQSPLIVYDALGEQPVVELRDGVAIKPETRTAEPKKKYDIELLEAGTTFLIRLELLVTEKDRGRLLRGLAIALQGLERGEIRLGARKRRGLGQCRVREWRVRRYDLRAARGLVGWLKDDRSEEKPGTDIARLLDVPDTSRDARRRFTVEGLFRLDGSLLIRSGSGEADAPDMVHLQSRRPGHEHAASILSGTSLAGALRARALRIAKTVGDETKARKLVDRLFGPRIESHKDEPRASHLTTSESVIRDPLSLAQTRVKIDRFTGGSFPTALFSEQPVWGADQTRLQVCLDVQSPTESEIGLVLLLLKDLWTGDLPLGGEVGVGRGRLRGQQATLTYDGQIWQLGQEDDRLVVQGDKSVLEDFVRAFHGEVSDEA